MKGLALIHLLCIIYFPHFMIDKDNLVEKQKDGVTALISTNECRITDLTILTFSKYLVRRQTLLIPSLH
jgi:hypothetical protein